MLSLPGLSSNVVEKLPSAAALVSGAIPRALAIAAAASAFSVLKSAAPPSVAGMSATAIIGQCCPLS
jgi:hypothetical protein